MSFKNTDKNYGSLAKFFHWTIGPLIVGLIGVGLYMTRLTPGPQMFKLFGLHKSVGIIVLMLATLRLSWRLMNPMVSSLSTHQVWEKVLARMVHGSLYIAMFLMPLSGWIMSSAKGYPVSLFDQFVLPSLVAPNEKLGNLADQIHIYSAYSLIVLIGLHVAGALKHHLIDKDITLKRMLPFSKPKT